MTPPPDTVTQAPYCIACRQSSAVKWRKHVFSRRHQTCVQSFLQLQVTRLQSLDPAVPAARESSSSLLSIPWRCVFCDAAFATADDVLTHCRSTRHHQRVDAFCRYYRCDVDRRIRSELWLEEETQQQQQQRRELAKRVRSSTGKEHGQATQQQEPDATDHCVAAFLSSATGRLHQVHAERWNSVEQLSMALMTGKKDVLDTVLGPQLVRARWCKTVTLSNGLRQNPLGRHEGKRVWGGGIVKLQRTEWIPWAIDQLVKDEQVYQSDMQPTGMEEETTYTHRVTESAQGEGLSAVTPVPWAACVGNIHTAAVPPWMVPTEEEYKKCNERKQVVPLPVVATGWTRSKADKKRRDMFSALQSRSACGQDWLPNFGGVWQDSPRSRTMQAFRKAASAVQPSSDCARAQQLKSSPLQVESLDSQPLPAVQDSVPELKQEVPCSSPFERNENKTGNPLDAKKQLLLAQKERLRAKMAAKRRQ